MDALYMALKLDLSHPSIGIQYLPDASDAISLFESGRDTFVDDHDARGKAFQGLQKATKKLKKFLEAFVEKRSPKSTKSRGAASEIWIWLSSR
jgi:hypothetical protein